ncbi:hypothetical protein CQ010_01540 [Arthrobacter sp. MYb211]|uniref:minor capsid protein n=1 Tax=unclassified Arthrobacter TaxID=235627 RepID=UPI000CFCAFB6|nr:MULTISPECIES: minor capsid protein [unclassified Arthrobacter]PRA13357.1 hypothetical protein CQ015_03795 [Arthrobacter sp. MYb221]PRC10554.1 hypothetical protein CQ010_01540 [Arthrobacter sp. MYb211]
MSFTVELLKGIARMLADNSIGEWSDDPQFVYTGALPAITLKRVPADPDVAIVLSAYGGPDHEYLPMGDVNVQIRVRGARNAPTGPEETLDAIFDLLHNARYVALVPGIAPVSRIHRKSTVPMGVDGNNRWEVADNYKVFASHPTQNR